MSADIRSYATCAAAGPGCQETDHIRLRHDAFIELGLVDEYAQRAEREARLDGWERAQAWVNDLTCGPAECRINALRSNYSVADSQHVGNKAQ